MRALIVLFALSCARADDPIPSMLGQVSKIRLRATVEKLVSFGTRHTLSDQADPKRGVGAAAKWIKSEFETIPGLQVEEQRFMLPKSARVPEPKEVSNIVVTLKGVTKSVVLVCAHYDSRASNGMDSTSDEPGANDDGSGIALVLECARLMAKLKPYHTVKFLAVTGEEQGLLGSRYFADTARKDGMEIIAVLSNDIVGNSRGGDGQKAGDRVRVFSEGVSVYGKPEAASDPEESPSRQLARFVAEVAGDHGFKFKPMLVYRKDRYGRGGDHSSFNSAGYPAIRFCEVYENFDAQHQDVRGKFGDTIDKMDFDYLSNVTRLNLAVLSELALAPLPPTSVRINARQGYDTHITWHADPATKYIVRWRETTNPLWQFSRDAGAANEITLKGISKDNFLFGVQSISLTGRRSYVVQAR